VHTRKAFTIVVFGKKKEEEFFKDFLAACSKQEYFSGMNEEMARRIFKYYGDVSEGINDCNNLDDTALMIAAERGLDIVKELLSRKADLTL
jgi:ankyrin repeat protein